MRGRSILSTLLLNFLCQAAFAQSLGDVYPLCGGCWCIPEIGEACPDDDIPETSYSDELISSLRSMRFVNPMDLNCDPYVETSCDTVPPLERREGVCAAEIMHTAEGQCPEDSSYRLHTVASREEAEAKGFLVTHEGPCGVCSTFQDLSVYITQPDLAGAGTACAIRSVASMDDGLKCYQEIGFTQACAAIWLYNTQNTRMHCLPVCLQHSQSGAPNNLPPPGCELAECIQCDEDASGPLFQLFGGRTRRRSGLLSRIVRPCNSMAQIVHQDPCLFEPSAQTPTPRDNSIAILHGNWGFLVSVGFWLVISTIIG